MKLLPPIVADVYKYRELMFAMAGRDIRVKYKQALMGAMWLIFMPVVGILAAITVRVAMAKLSGRPVDMLQVSQVMVRMTLWLFFAGALGATSNSLVQSMDLITKIYFPREVLPLATFLSRLFDFAISVVGVSIILLIMTYVSVSGGKPLVVASWSLLWFFPILLVLILLVVALGLILSAANLFYRDVKYVVEVAIRFGIFFTPVFLFVKDLGSFAEWAMLNPLAPLFEAIVAVIFAGSLYTAMGTDIILWPWLCYSLGCAVILLMLGTYSFRRAEVMFAEYG